MPAVGSSSSSSCGSDASARAISSRRWSPYGRLAARSWWRRGMPTSLSSSRARSSVSRSSRRTNGVCRIEPVMRAFMRQWWPTMHVLEHGHRLEQLDVLERARDAGLGDDVRRLRGDVAPVEHDLTRRRLVEAGHAVEERRLAGAVGADDRDDRLVRDGEVDVVDRHEAAEALGDAHRPRGRLPFVPTSLTAPSPRSASPRTRPRAARSCACGSAGSPRAAAPSSPAAGSRRCRTRSTSRRTRGRTCRARC